MATCKCCYRNEKKKCYTKSAAEGDTAGLRNGAEESERKDIEHGRSCGGAKKSPLRERAESILEGE
jgi:hypothetical protein